MYIDIVDNRSGESLLLRRLAPHEDIDPEFHVRKYFADQGTPLKERIRGHIPSGCADVYAETRDTKEPTGSCWSSYDMFYSDLETEY